jgi:hypothetical protein
VGEQKFIYWFAPVLHAGDSQHGRLAAAKIKTNSKARDYSNVVYLVN